MIKLCTDAAVQSEIGDEVLGRVFALYDIVFNVGYVIAVAAAALLSPPDGRAPGLLAGAALLYLVGLVAHDLELRRAGRRNNGSATPPADQHALQPVLRGPGAQLGLGLLVGQRAVLHAQRQQVLVGLPDQRARRDPEQLP